MLGRFGKILAGSSVLMALIAGGIAADPEPDWSLSDLTGFRSKTLPTGALFQIRVDGRTFIATKSTAATKLGDDASSGLYKARFDGSPISVEREMKFDPKRNAIRILDVLTNVEAAERTVRVEYTMSLINRAGVRLNGTLSSNGETRENGNGVPEDTNAAIVLAESSSSPALPLLVWGQRGAKWPANVSDIGSSFRLGYQGTIPRAGKVALVHWVATAGLDKSVKLERTFDLFWKDGHLIDSMLPADIIPLVANFKPEALTTPSSSPVAVSPGNYHLTALEAVCDKLGIKRGDKDQLWINKDAQVAGGMTAEKISITSQGKNQDIDISKIAALRGGGNRGRDHRLYLRDGSVLVGHVVLTNARLTSDIGDMKLDADSIDMLVLNPQPADGKPPEGASGLLSLTGGEQWWLGKMQDGTLELVTLVGKVHAPVSELVSLKRKNEAPFTLEAALKDGSRLLGVSSQAEIKWDVIGQGTIALPIAQVSAWQSAIDKPDGQPANRCTLRDGSILAGTLQGNDLHLRTANGALTVKVADITHLTSEPTVDEVTVSLTSGSKVKGELLDDSLILKRGAEVVKVAAGIVVEIVQSTEGKAESSEAK